MKTTDFSSKVTAAQLNENMFKKFGKKIKFENYSREQLENYRNLIRTEIFQLEASSNFNDLLSNESYQQNKYVMDMLNVKIKEMLGESKLAERKLSGAEKKKKEEIVKAIKRDNPEKRTGKGKSSAYAIATAQAKKTAEGTNMRLKTLEGKKAKPDFLDVDKDGNKKEPFKKAVKDKKVKESFPTVAGARAQADKEKGTEKFDKKSTSTGTQYTRKTSQLAKGEEDRRRPANTMKSKKTGKPMAEELKGKQSKIDADHDGKIEKSDFAKLRAKKKIKESTITFRRHVALVNESLSQLIYEDEEGKAKAITAASDMVNDYTTWMQRVGQYQTKSMIELSDTIRAEFGQAEAEAFKNSVAPALAATLETMTAQREAISHAVAVLAGEAVDQEVMGQEPGMGDEFGGADEFAGGEEVPGADMDSMNSDEFGASDAAAGGMETAGREMRESKEQRRARKLDEAHAILRTLSR